MKYRITIKRYHASSVRPLASKYIFTLSGRSCTPSLPLDLVSPARVTPSARRSHTGGKPHETPLELLALFVLALPLLFTLQNADDDAAAGAENNAPGYDLRCRT